jgi:acyl-coenzyme A synthetase/AMP-(fatty) acid ligase
VGAHLHVALQGSMCPMDVNITLIAVGCAVLGAISTVVYYIFKAKELRVLREIRDRLPK